MPRLLSTRLRQRYLASTWEEIVERLVNGPIVATHPFHPASPRLQQEMRMLLDTQTFLPAGNTLAFTADARAFDAADSQVASALQPNCSIVDDVTVAGATRLWEQGIGVGTTMAPHINPVPHLLQLQRAWDEMKAQHRPLRGNMFVYPASGAFVHDFIDLKATPAKADALPGFNISVAVNSTEPLPDAVLDSLATAAWTTGDPGVVFMDRVNAAVPLLHAAKTIKTLVPCGEQGMFDGEFCTLGSINLNSSWLANPVTGELCFQNLQHAVQCGVTFLDNAVDVCAQAGSRDYRRVGLGVMGWADYLARHHMPYDSDDARHLAAIVSAHIGAAARRQSTVLAAERGPFPRLLDEPFYTNSHLTAQDAAMGFPRTSLLRNVSVTCLAPTGGISLLTKNRGFAIEPFFAEANAISARGHLLMAAAWQTGMCNSVSKTVNLPHDATVADVKAAILLAYECKQLKALSLYRAGSRAAQPIRT